MDLLSAAILLIIIMDPLGNIPIFHSLLSPYPRARRLALIGRELLIAYLVLLAFLFGGDLVMRHLGLEQPALGVAGGVVLFIIALRMVFPEQAGVERHELDEEPFIVPLAIPMIAGPSAIAAVLLLVSREPEQIWTWLAALSMAWSASAAILLASGLLMEKIGPHALRALVRLTGMLLIMMAVQMLMDSLAVFVRGLLEA
ncbi:MAG: MarC family protein [Sphingobacteriia bacterium]|nr:MarC family protein [Sphingobacteriia bacterium]NCC39841.1 MarC family protein [Gammaproteobacteria bacterium]